MTDIESSELNELLNDIITKLENINTEESKKLLKRVIEIQNTIKTYNEQLLEVENKIKNDENEIKNLEEELKKIQAEANQMNTSTGGKSRRKNRKSQKKRRKSRRRKSRRSK
jgi:hypothetical protein